MTEIEVEGTVEADQEVVTETDAEGPDPRVTPDQEADLTETAEEDQEVAIETDAEDLNLGTEEPEMTEEEPQAVPLREM